MYSFPNERNKKNGSRTPINFSLQSTAFEHSITRKFNEYSYYFSETPCFADSGKRIHCSHIIPTIYLDWQRIAMIFECDRSLYSIVSVMSLNVHRHSRCTSAIQATKRTHTLGYADTTVSLF